MANCSSCGSSLTWTNGQLYCESCEDFVCESCYYPEGECTCGEEDEYECPYCGDPDCYGECEDEYECPICGEIGCYGECEEEEICPDCGEFIYDCICDTCPYDCGEPGCMGECEEGEKIWCDYCEEYTDHNIDNCPYYEEEPDGTWCDYCEEYTDHNIDNCPYYEEEEEYEYCEHCKDTPCGCECIIEYYVGYKGDSYDDYELYDDQVYYVGDTYSVPDLPNESGYTASRWLTRDGKDYNWTGDKNQPFEMSWCWNNQYGITGSNGSYSVKLYSTLTPIITPCTAPTTFTVDSTIFENSIEFAWSGAKGGTHNNITGYKIQCCVKVKGSTSWGSWKDVWSNNQNSVTLYISYLADRGVTINRGDSVKFRIATLGSAGTSYNSGWKESIVVVRNSLPSKPTNPRISKIEAEPGEVITVSWINGSDIDGEPGHLVGHRLVRSTLVGETGDLDIDDDRYVTIEASWEPNRSVTIPDAPGQEIKLLVRSEDALYAYSDWLLLGVVTIVGTAGVVNIFSNGARGEYLPHIFDSTEKKWKPIIPHLYANGWKECN